MKKLTLTIAALALCSLPPLASAAAGAAAGSSTAPADAAKSQADLEKQLDEARAKLQEDARRVADLSMQVNGRGESSYYYSSSEGGSRKRGFLGIDLADNSYGTDSGAGVEVSGVNQDSPADKAGLKEGDVITGINGTSFKGTDDASPGVKLMRFMKNVKPGDKLAIDYTRDGKAATAKVVAGDARDTYSINMPAFSRRPVLGIDVGLGENGGLAVVGVTPDGPADKAGLQAGDELTAVNGTALKPGNDGDARDTLFAVMGKVHSGDKLKVDYSRDGKAASTTVTAVSPRDYFFSFKMPPMPPMPPMPAMPAMPAMPEMPAMNRVFGMYFGGGRWGDMQLAPVSEGLGKYFGTDHGLLVLRAPKDSTLQLQDGDVITAIGGRDPGTPSHAMRILGSYSLGESVKLEIMRKGKAATLNVALPKSKDDSGTAFNFRVPDTGDDDDADGR